MRIIGTITTFILSSIPILSISTNHSATLELLHIIIAAICSICLFSYSKNSYSLYKVFYIFVLFFFSIAPIMQYKDNIHFFGTPFNEYDYIYTTIYILIFILTYEFTYRISFKHIKIKHNKEKRYHSLKTRQEIIFIILSTIIFMLILYSNRFNIKLLFFRNQNQENFVLLSNMSYLILNNFLRPIGVILFLTAYILKTKHKIALIALFLLMLISSFPTSMPRFAAAALYIPIVMIFIPFFKRKNLFVLFFVIGILLLFPFLDNFRYTEIRQFKIGLDFKQFEELHFDAYSMFMRVLKDDIITHGQQLLGVFLFWVPRSIWPNKPIGSGAYMAQQDNLFFENVSMPFIGEGYLNFGSIGVVIFSIIIAICSAYIDKYYWNVIVKEKSNIQSISYFMLLGLLFFMYRGDLLSSFAYTCGFLFAFIIVTILCSYKKGYVL